MVKRSFDMVCSVVGLCVLSPMLLTLAVIIKLGSPGPVFYRGRRVGQHGKPFQIFKFRSMVVNAEQVGGPSTSDDDPRITPIGRFMRKYKLDELPQLLNVVRGEMSLVGPRPQVPDYVARFTDEEKMVLRVPPGITDWASIWNSDEGAILALHPDPDKAYDELVHPTKMRLQLLYARRHSLWIDLKILTYTVYGLVRRGWVPAEIRSHLAPGSGPVGGLHVANDQSYETVTEVPGIAANAEQLAMLYTRYGWAGEIAAGKEVLEVACGSGIGLGHLAARATRVVGGDCDHKLAEIARRQYDGRIKVQELDAQSLPYPDDAFDVVILFEAIYYLEHPESFVREARRVLRPGGSLVMCSANCERPDFNASPYSTRYYSARALQDLLEQNGFRAKIYAGFPLQPQGGANYLRQACRSVAVKLRLIPKTMKWKSRLKRLFFGKLQALPAALGRELPAREPLVPIDAGQPVPGYKVLYAIGQRGAVEQPTAVGILTGAHKVPYFDYTHVFTSDERALTAVFVDVGRRGAFIQQRDLEEFEARLARHVGARYVVGIANATDALHLALRAVGIGPGDDVIFCSHTMVATAAAVHWAGATPVPVECRGDHLIDPNAVEEAITGRTKAILPTQLNGRTADMDALQAIADRHGLLILEDAAQALGSKFKGRCAGTFGKAACISFYPAKTLGCFGDGGCVITSDDEVYRKLRLLRDHGRDEGGEVRTWGLNSRLDNLQAAILSRKLDTYDQAIARRREIASLYDQYLANIPQLVLPPAPDSDSRHFDIFQNYELEAERRNELQVHLKARGVGTLVPWGGKAVHQFSGLGFTQHLPFTEKLFQRLLMLPMNTSLSNEDVRYVCDSVRSFFGVGQVAKAA